MAPATGRRSRRQRSAGTVQVAFIILLTEQESCSCGDAPPWRVRPGRRAVGRNSGQLRTSRRKTPRSRRRPTIRIRRPVARSLLPRRTPPGSRGCTPVTRKLIASASAASEITGIQLSQARGTRSISNAPNAEHGMRSRGQLRDGKCAGASAGPGAACSAGSVGGVEHWQSSWAPSHCCCSWLASRARCGRRCWCGVATRLRPSDGRGDGVSD